MINLNEQDRFRGALFGLATGDALGQPVEFNRPGWREVREMLDGGTWGLQAGQWTDDTIMALHLASSLIANKGWVDSQDQLARYVRWYKQGELSPNGRCFDIGGTTASSLEIYIRTGQQGQDVPDRGSNGSIMRLAPVAMVYAFAPRRVLFDRLARSSMTTHRGPDSVAACVALGAAMRYLLIGGEKTQVFAAIEASNISIRHKMLFCGFDYASLYPKVHGHGGALDTFRSALWAFLSTDNFEEALVRAIGIGGDTDTVGAVCGQLAGAHYGYNAIPRRWADKVWQNESILSTAEELYLLALQVKMEWE